jgi:hypothetical protein
MQAAKVRAAAANAVPGGKPPKLAEKKSAPSKKAKPSARKAKKRK